MTLNEYLSLFINSVVKFAKIANVFCIGVLYFYLYNLYNSLNTFPVITAQKEKTEDFCFSYVSRITYVLLLYFAQILISDNVHRCIVFVSACASQPMFSVVILKC